MMSIILIPADTDQFFILEEFNPGGLSSFNISKKVSASRYISKELFNMVQLKEINFTMLATHGIYKYSDYIKNHSSCKWINLINITSGQNIDHYIFMKLFFNLKD